ncbi:unnamed protein product, partial [Allacma fusca]
STRGSSKLFRTWTNPDVVGRNSIPNELDLRLLLAGQDLQFPPQLVSSVARILPSVRLEDNV